MKISIITVCLNSKKTIRDTLNSVLSQTYTNIEHIIIDGGSTDGTYKIIEEYPNKNKKVYIKKKTGIYSAMNEGIKRSTGEIICILNSDDIYNSNTTIENTVKYIEKYPKFDLYFGDVVYFEGNQFYDIKRYYQAKKFSVNLMQNGDMPPHPASFVRKKIYKKIGLYNMDMKIASDFDFFLRCLKINNRKYKLLNQIIVRMRVGGASGKNLLTYITTTREILKSLKLNKINHVYFYVITRSIYKLQQLILFDTMKLNKNFEIFNFKFQTKYYENKTFKIIKNISKLPFDQNFILSGMNLAFLGYYSNNTVYPSKDLYHWPDGLFAKKIANVEKIPGRDILNKLKLSNKITSINVLGNISEQSKKYLKKKFKKKINCYKLPYSPIELIKREKIILKKNQLTIITLPTPKQEQLAYYLSKKNKHFKIICIGASLAIASGEEKVVPKIIQNYEYIWRLRTDTFRRLKRLIESLALYYKGKFLLRLYSKTLFKVVDK